MNPRPTLLAAALSLVAATADAGPAANETDPRKIMEAVEARDTGDKMTAAMTMTILDDSGRKRVRKLRARAIEVDGGTRHLMLFESPADVRNTALLSVDYDDGGEDDDQWLYLPSMRKTVRISGGDKSGSFVGSDLSYSDMTKHHASQYDYALLDGDTRVDGEPCWLIEARPRTDRAKKETGYAKIQLWVSKQKLMPLQAKAWIKAGKKLKLMKYDDVRKVDGVWVAHKTAARTTQNGKVQSTTVTIVTNVSFGDDSVTADDFTQRRMEQGL